jgi:hypothetical protein
VTPVEKILSRLMPETWCQGAFGRDEHGDICDPGSPIACQRCLMGWFMWASPRDEALQLRERARQLIQAGTRYRTIIGLNDQPNRQRAYAAVHAILLQLRDEGF